MKFIKKAILFLVGLALVSGAAYALAPEDTKAAIRKKVLEVTGTAQSLSFSSLLDDSAHVKLKELSPEFANAIKQNGSSVWDALMESGGYMKDGKVTEEEARKLAEDLVNIVIESNPDLDVDNISVPDLNSVLLDTFLAGGK